MNPDRLQSGAELAPAWLKLYSKILPERIQHTVGMTIIWGLALGSFSGVPQPKKPEMVVGTQARLPRATHCFFLTSPSSERSTRSTYWESVRSLRIHVGLHSCGIPATQLLRPCTFRLQRSVTERRSAETRLLPPAPRRRVRRSGRSCFRNLVASRRSVSHVAP